MEYLRALKQALENAAWNRMMLAARSSETDCMPLAQENASSIDHGNLVLSIMHT
jgi:hypothetical protein